MGINFRQRIAVTTFLLGLAMILIGLFSGGSGMILSGVALLAGSVAIYMLKQRIGGTVLRGSLSRHRKVDVLGEVVPVEDTIAMTPQLAALWNIVACGQHTGYCPAVRIDLRRQSACPFGMGLGDHRGPRSATGACAGRLNTRASSARPIQDCKGGRHH